MISLKQVARSILIASAIALSILTFSNPSSAGKKKTPYVCATGSDVVIRDGSFQAISKMSKGQCIKLFTEPPIPELQFNYQNGEKYYGLQKYTRGTAIHAGWVSTRFTKIQYR